MFLAAWRAPKTGNAPFFAFVNLLGACTIFGIMEMRLTRFLIAPYTD